MKWTVEKDNIFIVKLIESHGVRIDYNKLAAAWPKETNDNPTPKALSEHMYKIRKLSGLASTPASATATPSRSTSANFKTLGSGSKTSTPTKHSTGKSKPSRYKRARVISDSDDDEDLFADLKGKKTPVRGVSKLDLRSEKAGSDDVGIVAYGTAVKTEIKEEIKGEGKENGGVVGRNRPSRAAAAKCQEEMKKAEDGDDEVGCEEDVDVDEGFGDWDEEEYGI